jgi:hypothetical protein
LDIRQHTPLQDVSYVHILCVIVSSPLGFWKRWIWILGLGHLGLGFRAKTLDLELVAFFFQQFSLTLLHIWWWCAWFVHFASLLLLFYVLFLVSFYVWHSLVPWCSFHQIIDKLQSDMHFVSLFLFFYVLFLTSFNVYHSLIPWCLLHRLVDEL